MDDAVLEEALGRGANDRAEIGSGVTAELPAGGIPLDRDL